MVVASSKRGLRVLRLAKFLPTSGAAAYSQILKFRQRNLPMEMGIIAERIVAFLDTAGESFVVAESSIKLYVANPVSSTSLE